MTSAVRWMARGRRRPSSLADRSTAARRGPRTRYAANSDILKQQTTTTLRRRYSDTEKVVSAGNSDCRAGSRRSGAADRSINPRRRVRSSSNNLAPKSTGRVPSVPPSPHSPKHDNCPSKDSISADRRWPYNQLSPRALSMRSGKLDLGRLQDKKFN